MGRRSRAREKKLEAPSAPSSDYTDERGNTLTLRGSLTPRARGEYAEQLAGAGGRPAETQQDRWQRAMELLFERLAVRWTIAPRGDARTEGPERVGASIERQRELLARLRAASAQERAWVRKVLREHCAEHFPDVNAP